HAARPTARPTPGRHGDAIYIRDGWRCSAPGCTSRRNLEDHHLIHRAHQGPDDLSNRTCLCRFHHGRCEHGGLGTCKGTAPLGITWRLGPREAGIWYRNDRRVERAPPD
ncbi:MAG: HNH endonuclease signature motif containing protein, partial [Acidobacteriota bacterium]